MTLKPLAVPAPWGSAPRQRDLDELIARSAFGRILARARGPGRDVARTVCPVSRGALDELGPGLRIREEARPAQCACRGGALALELFGPGERVGVVELHHGIAIRWSGWNADAELARGDAVRDWLTARGISDEPTGFDPRAAAERFAATAPPELAPWPGALIDPRGGTLDLPRLLEASSALEAAQPSPIERARLLLEWLGRDEHYPWAHDAPHARTILSLLSMLGEPSVLQASAGASSEAARLGAARFVTDSVTTRAQQRRIVPALIGVRDALVEAVSAGGVADNVRRLEAVLDRSPPAAPEGTRLVAVAQHGRLSRVCRERDRAFALDGDAIARFDAQTLEGAELARLAGVRPALYASGGKVFFRLAGELSSVAAEGGPVIPARPGLWARVSSTSFGVRLASRRLDEARRKIAAPLLERAGMPVFLEADPEEQEAWEALRAVGAAWPRVVANEVLAWIDIQKDAVHWSLGTRTESPKLDGKPIHLAAGDDGLYGLLERSPGEHVVVRIASGGAVATSARITAPPGAIVQLTPLVGAACLKLETPLGDLLVDVPVPAGAGE